MHVKNVYGMYCRYGTEHVQLVRRVSQVLKMINLLMLTSRFWCDEIGFVYFNSCMRKHVFLASVIIIFVLFFKINVYHF